VILLEQYEWKLNMLAAFYETDYAPMQCAPTLY